MNLLILSLALAQAPIFFTTNSAPPAAATPTFAPPAGTYSGTQSVTISSASGCGSYIYWNLTGSPTTGDTHSTTASITATNTLYAKVIGCPNFANSAVGQAAYTITASNNYGLTTQGHHGGDSYSPGYVVVQKITIPASKTCTSISWMTQGVSAGRKYRLGCYAAGAAPTGSVIAQTAEITSPGDSAGWITTNFIASFNSGAGGTFWCGGQTDTFSIIGYNDDNTDGVPNGSMAYSDNVSYSAGGLPTWPGGGGTIPALNSLYVTCQ